MSSYRLIDERFATTNEVVDSSLKNLLHFVQNELSLNGRKKDSVTSVLQELKNFPTSATVFIKATNSDVFLVVLLSDVIYLV